MPGRRTNLKMLIATLALAVGACTRVGQRAAPESVGPSAPAAVAEDWAGSVTLGGRELPVVLRLRPDDAPEKTSLRIPELSLEALGDATWGNERIQARLAYGEGTSCPGSIALQARLTTDGTARGNLTATDCTGSETGAVVLSRRGSLPPLPSAFVESAASRP